MSPQITSVSLENVFPLSCQQEDFCSNKIRLETLPNLYLPMVFRSRPDTCVVERTLTELILRHDSLRTNLRIKGGTTLQETVMHAHCNLEMSDLSKTRESLRDTEACRLATEAVMRRFDFFAGPVVRAHLITLCQHEHRLLVMVPHLFSDGRSLSILATELRVLYAAFSQAHSSPLPEPKAQYRDFVLRQRDLLNGAGRSRMKAYYASHFEGAEKMGLQTDYPRSAVIGVRVAGRAHFSLSRELSSAVVKLSRSERVTPFTVLLAAYNVLLSRWSGQSDVMVGAILSGRALAHTTQTVGLFSFRTPLRSRVSRELTFRNVLQHTRNSLLQAFCNEDVLPSLRESVPELSRSISVGMNHVGDIDDNTESRSPEVTGAELEIGEYGPYPVPVPYMADLELHLSVTLSRGKIIGRVRYAADLFREETIGRRIEDFKRLLTAATIDPGMRLS